MKRKLVLLGLLLVSTILAVTQGAALAATGGTTLISGEVGAATISITPPSPITLGSFAVGDVTGSSLTPGAVTVTAGTAGYPVAYAVHAADANTGAGQGFMMNGATQLSATNKFQIGRDGAAFFPADAGFTYSGNAASANATSLPFFVRQHISGNETAGSYSITVAFTASLP